MCSHCDNLHCSCHETDNINVDPIKINHPIRSCMSITKNKTPDRRLKNVQNTSISDKKATNYKIKQTQQVTVPSSEEIIASCNVACNLNRCI